MSFNFINLFPYFLLICVSLQYVAPDMADARRLKGHQLSVTCVTMTPDDKFIYSGSKDCCIIKCKGEKSRT